MNDQPMSDGWQTSLDSQSEKLANRWESRWSEADGLDFDHKEIDYGDGGYSILPAMIADHVVDIHNALLDKKLIRLGDELPAERIYFDDEDDR